MTAPNFTNTIVDHCQPLDALPTDAEPKLQELAGVRAVLFDIYGTLLISASGDIGANSGDHRLGAIEDCVGRFQLKLQGSALSAIEEFESEIARVHTEAIARGTEYPEVDIVEVWQAVLPRIVADDLVSNPSMSVDYSRFALEYEVRVNPVWLMPGVDATLRSLASSELVLGIVSNAQFFTPHLFPALLGKNLEELGFSAEMLYFSYEHRQAKPGSHLYRLARRSLEQQGIRPAEVLYVGNDMLNDIGAAATVGFRTALFAGDRRSLRWRQGEKRIQGVVPDLVITELTQLIACLAIETT